MQKNSVLGRITLHVATKDRHSEAALLLQSLRTQTWKDFDCVILDDASGTPITNCHFFMSVYNKMIMEGHKMKLVRSPYSKGVCHARNTVIDNDDFGNEYVCRLDDDVILETDYLERLLKVIEAGYDLASGVVPLIATPEHIRETRFIGEVINEHELDKEGNIVKNSDDCGYGYTESVILPTHQFRTNALMKKKVVDAGVRYPDFLSYIGFREEGFFSFQALIKGFKIGVDTGAIAYHLRTPSGGCRTATYNEDVARDDQTFREWTKKQYLEHGNFLK